MPNYRRLWSPGATYFFTVKMADRTSTALVDEIDLLRNTYASVIAQHPVNCHAFVVLPDHLHAVWTLPNGDADFAIRWRKLKSVFSRHCTARGLPSASQIKKGEKGIWQRRYWEHLIRDEQDFSAHIQYCHENPMRHGYVHKPEDWPFSTIHRTIKPA